MRILLIGAVFYPRNSPRALRTTELAKYFASKGHEVIVYTCTGKYDYENFHNQHKVIVKNIHGRKFYNLESDGSGEDGILSKIGKRLLERSLEWPSIELMFKMGNILRSENNIDLLITVAIPYPIHWGVARSKRSLGSHFPKVWISDCGDPYMGNSVGKKHPFYFKYIERYWCQKTDYITVPIEAAKKAYYSDFQNKIRVIPQGFDFSNVKLSIYSKNKIPSFAFAGATYPGYRDPSDFLVYLSNLDEDFRFTVFTPDNSIFHKHKDILKDKLIIRPYVPREELLKILSSMDFLININNSSDVQSPSKLIDYGITGRPVLSISSTFSQQENFMQFFHGNYIAQEEIDISQFDIANVGEKFLKLYKEKLNENSHC